MSIRFCAGLKSLAAKVAHYNEHSRLLHQSFEVAILLKGLNAMLEIVSGFLLMFATPDRLQRFLAFAVRQELVEDPNDAIANYLIKVGAAFTTGTQWFGEFYLLSHGIVKIFLVVMLWRRKLWAYPLTIVSLLLFIAYQLYRYTHTHSLWLIALTFLDVTLILLAWSEYERLKNDPSRWGPPRTAPEEGT